MVGLPFDVAPPRRRIRCVINPVAGSGNGVQLMARMRPFLELNNIDVSVLVTEGPGHARLEAQNIAVATHSGILVVGGGGTVGEVINGLLDRDDWDGTRGAAALPIGVIPAGRENALAECMGTSKSVWAALLTVVHASSRPLDILSVSDGERIIYGTSLAWGLPAAAAPRKGLDPLRFLAPQALRSSLRSLPTGSDDTTTGTLTYAAIKNPTPIPCYPADMCTQCINGMLKENRGMDGGPAARQPSSGDGATGGDLGISPPSLDSPGGKRERAPTFVHVEGDITNSAAPATPPVKTESAPTSPVAVVRRDKGKEKVIEEASAEEASSEAGAPSTLPTLAPTAEAGPVQTLATAGCPGGHASLVAHAPGALADAQPMRVAHPLLVVASCNPAAPFSHFSDGLIDLILVSDAGKGSAGKRRAVQFLHRLANRNVLNCDWITYEKCLTAVEIKPTGPGENRYQLDGELLIMGATTVRVHTGLCRLMSV